MRWTLRILSGLCVLTFGYVWTVGQAGLNSTNKNLCELWNAVWPWPWESCAFHTAILMLWAVAAIVSLTFLITELVRWLLERTTPAVEPLLYRRKAIKWNDRFGCTGEGVYPLCIRDLSFTGTN